MLKIIPSFFLSVLHSFSCILFLSFPFLLLWHFTLTTTDFNCKWNFPCHSLSLSHIFHSPSRSIHLFIILFSIFLSFFLFCIPDLFFPVMVGLSIPVSCLLLLNCFYYFWFFLMFIQNRYGSVSIPKLDPFYPAKIIIRLQEIIRRHFDEFSSSNES